MLFNIEQGILGKKTLGTGIYGNSPNLPMFPPSKVSFYTVS